MVVMTGYLILNVAINARMIYKCLKMPVYGMFRAIVIYKTMH